MAQLTVQIWYDGQWHNAAYIQVTDTDAGVTGTMSITYQLSYVLENFDHKGSRAISARYPVEAPTEIHETRWPAFIDDIIPSGHARRRLVERFNLGRLTERQQDFELLKKHTVAPIGNLRIRESVPEEQTDPRTFPIQDVIERDYYFVDYAYEKGAASGGASGAGGEAPKFLIRLNSNNEVWIDTLQNDALNTDIGYLIKFPRNRASEKDKLILKAEWAYYHFAAELGFDTIDVTKMRWFNGDEFGRIDPKPSLWLPRFDMGYQSPAIQRYGMESVYSLLNANPGSNQLHIDALKAIDNYLKQFDNYDAQAVCNEYLKRDLLNIILGNSDNHCRNIAIIKYPNKVGLSPIYDLAPMKIDDEGIVRTTRWGKLERGGEFEWEAICNLVAKELENVDEIDCLNALKELASALTSTKQKLQSYGLEESFLELPVLGFNHIEDKLTRWKLL